MIHIFKARDGLWNMAPASVANWPQFRQQGVYQCKEQAAAMARVLHPGEAVKIESAGFFGG